MKKFKNYIIHENSTLIMACEAISKNKSMGNNDYVVRLTKSGQTTIYTEYSHGAVGCTATRSSGGLP